jgi:hypothetical protein
MRKNQRPAQVSQAQPASAGPKDRGADEWAGARRHGAKNQRNEIKLLMLSKLLFFKVVLLRRRFFEKGLAAAVREILRHGRAGAAIRPIG